MNSRLWRLAAVVLCSLAMPAMAADLRDVLTDYNVTAWGDKDGLPRGTIWTLAQDQQGYIWIGSESGLIRFDGLRFTPWADLGNEPLFDESVRALYNAKDGSLWVGFGRSGIVRIRGRHVQRYTVGDGLPAGEVVSLVEDRTGVIWAGHSDGLYRFAGDRWQKVSTIPPGRVRRVVTGGSGRLFVVLDQSVLVRNPGSDRFEPVATPEAFVSSVHEDAQGRVWMADLFLGVMTDPAAGVTRLRVRPSGSGTTLAGAGAALLSDHDGGLWIGTSGQGLWRARTPTTSGEVTVETVTTITGLSNDIIHTVLEDRDGNIWAGTADGLNRLRRHPFTSLASFGAISGIDAGADGTVWAATATGLMRFATRGEHPVEQMVAPGLQLRAMHADAHGALWAATDGGLVRYAGSFPSVVSTQVLDTLRRIRSITSDANGNVWLYDLDRGLGRWDGERLELIDLPAEYRHALICGVHADRSGRLWVGFRQERLLAVNLDRSLQWFGPAEGLDPGTCNGLSEDRDGRLWVFGVHGLSRFANGRFTTLRRPGELPLEGLQGMVEDAAGGVWLTSLSGIAGMQPADVTQAFDGHWDRVRANVYNASSGVAGKAARVGRSAIRTNDGYLWFLTSRGVTLVDPTAARATSSLGRVNVDSVTVDDQRASGLPDALAPRIRRVEIEYSLPYLTPGPRPRFRYRLDGFDTQWHDAGPNQRRVAYTNLPARSYRFQVEHLSVDGSTPASNGTWTFSVRPAFYQTAWFAVLGLIAAGGVASLAWRQRLTQVRGEFALLLKERVRLSREIHDTLLQSLIGVSLQLEQVEHDVDTSTSGRQRLIRARKQVEEYIREARESIWNLRSSALEREGLATALRHAGERAIAESSHGDGEADLTFTVSGAADRCSPDVEEQLLRIGQEAVTNATRHGAPHHIRMELRYDESEVTLRVSDDGRGFDPEHLAGVNGTHWGLVNMRERAATAGGTLHIASVPGSGTQIEATVPKHAPSVQA